MNTLAQTSSRAELLGRLRRVRPDSPARWGGMTAHQMICHLGDACRMALGEKQVSDVRMPLPRTVMKFIALYTPLRWRPGIMTSPEIDQRCQGTTPSDFAVDLAQLEALLDRVASRDDGSRWPTHPAFGRMTRGDWMRWGYLHTDHHLRQFGV